MKLSTRSRYALEALLYMAIYSEDDPISIKQISNETKISEGYLEQIFFRLRSTNILSALRGAKGGYIISIPTNKLTVGMIVRAMERNLVPVICVKDINLCKSKIREKCVTRNLWIKVLDTIDSVMDNITLYDLKEKYLSNGD